MDISQIIKEKVELTRDKTGYELEFEEPSEEHQDLDAYLDFPSWHKKSRQGLPAICARKDISGVHVLHELIHLEKFFIERFPIVMSSPKLHAKIDVFKNIPEDYVVHKIIYHTYNLNPIGRSFLDRDNINDGRSDKQIAADLAHYYFFSEFDKGYRKRLAFYEQQCSRQKHHAYLIAQKAIKCISAIDYNDKLSYGKSAEELISIFEPNDGQICLAFFEKEGSGWKYSKFQTG